MIQRGPLNDFFPFFSLNEKPQFCLVLLFNLEIYIFHSWTHWGPVHEICQYSAIIQLVVVVFVVCVYIIIIVAVVVCVYIIIIVAVVVCVYISLLLWLLLLLFVFISLLMLLMLFLNFFCLVFHHYSVSIDVSLSNVHVFHKLGIFSVQFCLDKNLQGR